MEQRKVKERIIIHILIIKMKLAVRRKCIKICDKDIEKIDTFRIVKIISLLILIGLSNQQIF